MQAKNIKESRVQNMTAYCNIKYSVDLKNGYLSAAYL